MAGPTRSQFYQNRINGFRPASHLAQRISGECGWV